MPMLQFKMGNWTNLNNTAKAPIIPGTVYITKDERSMYVDIDSTTRIRINDIIQHASATDALPPFNPDAFYYFSAENALMKYNGVDAEGKHQWTQLNSTADVADKVNKLTTRVGLLETDNGVNKADIAQLKLDVVAADEKGQKGINDAATAQAQANKGVADAATAQAKANANETAINGLKTTTQQQATAIGGLDTRLTTAEGKVTNLEANLKTVGDALGSKTDGSEKATAFGRIQALEDTTATHTTQIGNLSQDLTNLTTEVGKNSTSIGQNASAIEANEKAIEDLQKAVGTGAEGLASKVENLTGRVNSAESGITDLDSRLDTAEGNIAGLQQKTGVLETTVSGHTTSINSLSGTVDGHTTNITNLQHSYENLEGRVQANENAIGSVANPNTGNANGTIYERIKKNAEDISEASTQVELLKTAVGKLNGDETETGSVAHSVKTATDALKEELQAEIDNDIIAANAMEYKDGLATLADLQALTNVKIGDTYIATQDFKLADNTQVYAGDLIIAKSKTGKEEANGFIASSNLEWNHVNTGYKQSQEPGLKGKNNEILLSTYLNPESGNLGKISFVTEENCSATVKVANDTVTIGIEWGSFD